ncbi:MAG TPA: hypothetical protein VL334_00980 [Anaerolineae bacterium]|nr:hypothetical protein [Anaerolineae bacterium]
MTPESAITLQLNTINEMFTAPAANPFSSHAVDILGEAGLDIVQKRVLQHWPRLPRAVHLTVRLPVDRITSEVAQGARVAMQHYYASKIEDNRLQRRLTIRRSLRQLLGAGVGILLALAFIALLVAAPLGLLPPFLRGVLIVLALYACSVLSFDAVWSLAFDWLPYVQENKVYRVLEASELTIEPALSA